MLDIKRIREDFEGMKAGVERRGKGDFGFDQIRELDVRIRKFIASMPEQRRKVFLLSRAKGMGNKAIAELLGLSVRTVDRHINIALTSLKKEFKK